MHTTNLPTAPSFAPRFAGTVALRRWVRATLPLALALAACVTDGTRGSAPATAAASGRDRGWVEPTEDLAREIDRHVRSVRAGRSMDVYAREAEWFGGVGEPAYGALLELAGDVDVRIASFGLATLAAQRDSRLLAPLRAAVPQPADGPLRLEYARTLVALGDWSEVPTLLDALTSEDVRVRGSAFKALREATGEAHGFHPQASAEERAAAVERWRTWWTARASDPRLAPVN
jgi:hypothetical protein